MVGTAQSIRSHRGLALFSGGFRPFFLFPALWGAAVVPIWIASLHFSGGLVAGLDGRAWHVHEMLFGFLAGIIAGFLLTAIPNWTGRLPVTGTRLAGLFGLWAAGRVISLAPTPWPLLNAAVESSFLVVFAAVVWREIVTGRNKRNVPVCLLVTALASANLLYHFGAVSGDAQALGQRLALSVATGLIALIGGRIIPSFTQNWFASQAIGPGPAAFGGFDKAVLGLTGAAMGLWTFWPDLPPVGGFILVLAGAAHVARLLRWRGWKAASEPLVWILHVAYLWLGVGLGLLGASVCWPGAVAPSTGIHAITAGAVGVMTLAVMTRATLGHTGRAREADTRTVAIYAAALAAGVVRTAAPFAADHSMLLLAVSAGLWTLAFGGFVVAYGPMLMQRRVAA